MVESSLKEAVFSGTRFQKCTMEADFTRADFMHAELSGVDLRKCVIDGALFAPMELQGLIVSREQAASIAAILGLKIM